MAFRCGPASTSASVSYVASFLSSPFHSRLKGFHRKQNVLFAISKDQYQYIEINPDDSEQLNDYSGPEHISPAGFSSITFEGIDGRTGFISFYNRPYKRDEEVVPIVLRNESSLLWFVGPAVLVASFIFPLLYLCRIVSTIFEDSLLTDFLVLFFTEALFYCGVAIFLLLIDHLRRPIGLDSSTETLAPHLGQRVTSVATRVLSLIIPIVTMGLVWPWTGPAAFATLAPYLVYGLHQLNRAAQQVTALSFTVRGAKMTTHNLAINNSLGSLGTLLIALQCLGVTCIWALSNFLMRFYPSTTRIT